MQAYTWSALFLPKGAPADVVKKLNEAAVGAIETPSVQERLKGLGATVAKKDEQSAAMARRFRQERSQEMGSADQGERRVRWNDAATALPRRAGKGGPAMADIKILNPDALGKPLGQYSHLTRVKASEFVFIAGQVGVDKDGKVVGDDDFDAQCVQTFANIEAALKSVGAGWGNIVRVHHLPGALAGHSEIHEIPPARISQDVCQRRLSAQHAADDRPAGAGAALLVEVQAVAAL